MRRPRAPGLRRARRDPISGLAILLLLVGQACASDLMLSGGVYRHRGHGFSIEAPAADWSRAPVEGALLAFRRPEGDAMSMMTRCRPTQAGPAVLARHLLIGLPDRVLRQAGPVLFEGRNGWSQTFDVRQNGVIVRVKTVTVIAEPCVVDWVLVSRGDFEGAERAFDAWWASFRGGVERVAGAGVGS